MSPHAVWMSDRNPMRIGAGSSYPVTEPLSMEKKNAEEFFCCDRCLAGYRVHYRNSHGRHVPYPQGWALTSEPTVPQLQQLKRGHFDVRAERLLPKQGTGKSLQHAERLHSVECLASLGRLGQS